ncbi:MAG TPA: hypothetical protein VEH06_18610 [Candidatus Bathyarchaeia archaeon]|nr:hypothetical protein [Candidatus Bathyarchaeia archaeon]
MTNNKLVLTSFVAFAMISMAATTIMSTSQAYADLYCGKNWQGSFHVSPGFPSLSIPPGYPPYTPLCLPDNTKTISDK